MLTGLLLTLLACRSTPPTPGSLPPARADAPTLELGASGAPVLRLLDQLSAENLTLPASNLPEGEGALGVWTLRDGWRPGVTGARTGKKSWVREMPYTTAQKRFATTPPGLSLRRGEEELSFRPGVSSRAAGPEGAWDVADDHLFVRSDTDPGTWDPPLVLEHAGTASAERRLNFEASGLDPVAFARYQATIGEITRQALLLPAPGAARFQVQVPDGGRLRFGYALLPDPSRADDGEAELRVRVDGAERWVESAKAADGWGDATVDLADLAGRTVSIELSSDPQGSPAHDYAVFATPEIIGRATAEGPRRVIVVGIDTLRVDHLGINGYGRDTTPGMAQIAAQSLIFDSAWSPAPRTRPSFRTATTGRWPLPAMDAPTMGEVLSRAGYTTAGITANVHLTAQMGFADGFGWWEFENSAQAEEQVDRALRWLGAHSDEDAYLFLHLMDPHIFYEPPAPYLDMYTGPYQQGPLGDKYNRWMVLKEEREGDLKGPHKEFMKARYDGEINYMDQQLLRLVAAVDALPGRTLMVFHSDHGEEFWEHGSYEHNHTLYNELVHVLFWVRPPGGLKGGPRRLSSPVSLADLAPTLYEAAGVPVEIRPPVDGLSLAPLLDEGRAAERAPLVSALDERPLHFGYLMYDTERWAVLYRQGKYILHTSSGEEELYDLATDPGEQKNLVGQRAAELPLWRERLAQATGWPVGVGWRVDIKGVDEPFDVVFDAPVQDAGVIDPEAGRTRRANLEFGEKPFSTPERVATVRVSEDRLTVHITPGPEPDGIIYVLGPTESSVATLVRGATVLPAEMGSRGFAGGRLRLTAGAIIAPQDSEARRLGAHDGGSAGHEDLEALRALGYIQ